MFNLKGYVVFKRIILYWKEAVDLMSAVKERKLND